MTLISSSLPHRLNAQAFLFIRHSEDAKTNIWGKQLRTSWPYTIQFTMLCVDKVLYRNRPCNSWKGGTVRPRALGKQQGTVWEVGTALFLSVVVLHLLYPTNENISKLRKEVVCTFFPRKKRKKKTIHALQRKEYVRRNKRNLPLLLEIEDRQLLLLPSFFHEKLHLKEENGNEVEEKENNGDIN